MSQDDGPHSVLVVGIIECDNHKRFLISVSRSPESGYI